MIELVALVLIMALFFALIGYLRGWTRELISTAGIVLALFALFQFDTLLRGTLLASFQRDQTFLVQGLIFLAITFFAYQSNRFNDRTGDRKGDGRDRTQDSVLGALLGFFNGYLIWGSLWYFMDINEYPLSPFLIAPAPGSPSDQARQLLPLVVFGGGPGGSGDLLAGVVILFFIIVLWIL
jgi:lysylphosphatidylglycerol synthetase-like protein (DUF2156 family)